MPTYEYMCEKCEHEFEREQRISDPPVKTCPECKARRVKKLISRTSFVLKGSGWYSDLYSSPKSKTGDKDSESKPESGAASKADSSDATKSEAKPAKDSSAAAGKSSKKGPGKGAGKGTGKTGKSAA